jgi:acetyltransferase-like isoleucine patch superfamily enzyme
LKKFFKAFLGILATITIGPAILIAILHKMRGVKIKSVKTIFISYNVSIDNVAPELIEIGNDVKITRNVVILSHFHPTLKVAKYYGEMIKKKVVIEDGVFIGVGAIILPGVTLGEGSVIGAGAVVTKSIPPYSVVAGNPADVIKFLH